MTLAEIFSKEYLFDSMPPRESRLLLPFLIFFIVLLLVSIVVRFLPIKIEKMAHRYSLAFMVPSILGILYAFGRYERLAWLGSRAMFGGSLALLLVWTLVNTVWALRFIPNYKKYRAIEDRYAQYLPKPKKNIKK